MELWFTEKHTENSGITIKIKKHIHSEKSKFQQIDVFETLEYGKMLTLDGLIMITQKDEFIYHDMITHTAMAVNPDIKKVLIIGGGDGGTARELSRYASIEEIDMVEIDEKVVRVSQKYFQETAGHLENNKKVVLYFEDGINFVKNKSDYYDLIIVDSTDPIGPGEGLFTLEFYKNCYKALNDSGILVNQNESPYFEQNAKEMKRASSKLKKLFPIFEVYQFHMPTYPSGHWLFGFASKKLHPVDDAKLNYWENLSIKTKYYNVDLHKASFCLPTYVKEMLLNESK